MSTTTADDTKIEPLFATTEAASKLVTGECRFRSTKRGERAEKHPERPRNPADQREVYHSVRHDGVTWSRFQRVREKVQNPLADDEVTLWTICGFEGTADDIDVLLKDAGVWSRSKRVPLTDLSSDRYEAITLEDDTPMFWY